MDNQQNNIPPASQNNTSNSQNISLPPSSDQSPPSPEAEHSKNNEMMNDPSAQLNPEGNNVEQKKIRKRATKKDTDIRNFKCEHCDKSYLSYPALYTHCKQKHNTNNHSGRNRGRPKKDPGESEKNLYDPQTVSYFQQENRKGQTAVSEINNCTKNAFSFIYEINLNEAINRKMKIYKDINEHPFLGNFIKDGHNVDEEFENEKTPTDKVLMNYLNKMSVNCNENYFEKLIIFVTLFREHINIINNKDDFTVITEAEDVPEKSNEFITDFLFPEEDKQERDKQESFGFDKEESINLTRNLCNWMYTHNFTCSKLFLI